MATQSITQFASDRIRNVLETRGLTQEWLADETGIPMRTLARRLHKKNPSSMPLEDLSSIADVLKLPIVDLLPRPRAARRAA